MRSSELGTRTHFAQSRGPERIDHLPLARGNKKRKGFTAGRMIVVKRIGNYQQRGGWEELLAEERVWSFIATLT